MIDRLLLRVEGAVDGMEIHNARTGKVIGKVSVAEGGTEVLVSLTEPVRSDRLLLSGAGTTAITLIAAHGVTPEEIPVVGGFHPYLADELKK
jgi:hypothetical protein